MSFLIIISRDMLCEVERLFTLIYICQTNHSFSLIYLSHANERKKHFITPFKMVVFLNGFLHYIVYCQGKAAIRIV